MNSWIQYTEGMTPPTDDTFVETQTLSGFCSRGYAKEFNWGKSIPADQIMRFKVLSTPAVMPDLPMPPKPKKPTEAELQRLDELKLTVDLWNEWRHKNACDKLRHLHSETLKHLSIDQFVKVLADNAEVVRDALEPYDSGARSS